MDEEHIPIGTIRRCITTIAIVLVFLHLIWPNIAIDSITITLLLIAILPWLIQFIKSFELPGGVKVELHKLEQTTLRAESAGLLTTPKESYSFLLISNNDPNLALAGLRIEIEKRLELIIQSNGIELKRKMGIGQLLRILREKEFLTVEQSSILADMIGLLNSAVHGANVDEKSASWAIDIGPKLLSTLDEKIKK